MTGWALKGTIFRRIVQDPERMLPWPLRPLSREEARAARQGLSKREEKPGPCQLGGSVDCPEELSRLDSSPGGAF
jgi:hypothetical protein